MAVETEEVIYDIKLAAQGALVQLAELTASTASFKNKMNEATLAVQSFAQRTGLNIAQVKGLFKELDEAFAGGTGQSVVFGGTGSAAWDKVGEASSRNTNKMLGNVNALRIAFGILISMLIHQVVQAFQRMVTQAIDGLRELELSTYNLINAERRLSQQGVEITPKDLDSFIKKLQQLDPLLSKVQASELVAGLATKVAPAVGLTREEMESLGQSLVILSIRNKQFGKTAEETFQEGYNAILSGRISKGLNDLGLKLNDQVVKENAVRMGLVESIDAYDKLEGKIKAQIVAKSIVNLLEQNTNEELKHLPEYFKTADAAFGIFQANLSNILTDLGVSLGPLLAEIFRILADNLENLDKWFEENKQGISVLINSMVLLLETFRRFNKESKDLPKSGFDIFLDNLRTSIFRVIPGLGQLAISMGNIKTSIESLALATEKSPILKALAKLFGIDLASAADTATVAVEDLNGAVQEFDASKMIDEVEDIIQKTQEAQEDLSKQLGRKLADLDIEYDRKREDALKNLNRKVEDINRDTEQKILDIKNKRREEDKKREEDYQNRLWELQQKYLMDLEDALHERDARQIIRLQRQYAIDKEALERKKNLDDAQSKRAEKTDISKVRRDQQEKLAEAQRNYKQALEDLDVAKAREQADLQTWYDREQQDLKTAQDRKLQQLIEGWAEEKKITQENAQAVYDILKAYFGPGALTDQLYAYMAQSLANQAAQAAAGINTLGIGAEVPMNLQNAPVSTYGTLEGTAGGGVAPSYTPVWSFPGGLAEGGSYLARTPTSIDVAESGPEIITATPINRLGADINKLFMGASRGESAGGSMEIGVTLSPDLEARVIRKSMDATANVILKVNRTRI